MTKLKVSKKLRHNLLVGVGAFTFSSVCLHYETWTPVYIVLGILAFATCIAVYVGTRKDRDLNVYIAQEEDHFVSESRFQEVGQDDEIMH